MLVLCKDLGRVAEISELELMGLGVSTGWSREWVLALPALGRKGVGMPTSVQFPSFFFADAKVLFHLR